MAPVVLEFGGYGQDDWRITPTLTLNLGLRYEAHTPWVELNNRQDNLNLVTGAIEYAGVDGNSRVALQLRIRSACYSTPRRLRLVTGIVSRQDSRSRRIHYLLVSGRDWHQPASSTQSSFHADRGYRCVHQPDRTRPSRVRAARFLGIRSRERSCTSGTSVQPAMDQQWNLTVQSEASATTTFQIGYVGQHGTHLMVPTPYSQEHS